MREEDGVDVVDDALGEHRENRGKRQPQDGLVRRPRGDDVGGALAGRSYVSHLEAPGVWRGRRETSTEPSRLGSHSPGSDSFQGFCATRCLRLFRFGPLLGVLWILVRATPESGFAPSGFAPPSFARPVRAAGFFFV